MERQNDRAASVVGLLTVLALGIECFLVWLRPVPMLDPDESLFAVVAREMRTSGDYVTPTYRGEPFLDRPILYYWLLAASTTVIGECDFAFRLPSLLLGVGTVLATAGIARKLFGRLTGAAAALVLATTAGGCVLRQAVGHDSALVFFGTSAVYFGLSMTSAESKRLLWTSSMGLAVCLAGGLLSKGLLGIFLPAVGLAALWWSRNDRPDYGLLCVAVVLGLLAASIWYGLAESANPGYCRYFFGQRHWAGYLGDGQRHGGKSAWIYLPTLLVVGFPWVFLLFDRKKAASQWRDEGGVILWASITFLAFVCGRSRNPTYLLPIAPPLAVWCGKRLADWIKAPDSLPMISTYLRRMPWITTGLLMTAAIGSLMLFHRPISIGWWIGSAAFLLTASLVIWRQSVDRKLLSDRPRMWIATQTLAWSALTATVLLVVLPEVAWERSALSTLQAMRKHFPPSTPVVWYDHVPPSGYLYGGDFSIRRIYHDGLKPTPSQPTLLVCRASRLKDVENSPLTAVSEASHPGGKFHFFYCIPSQGPIKAN